jgi:hypothetical protein
MIRKDYHNKIQENHLFNRKKKEREPKIWRLKFSLFLLVLTIFAWFGFIFYVPYFTIQNFDFTGTDKSLAEKISIALKGELDSRKFFVLNKGNYFIFDEVKFKQKLEEMFILSHLEITKKFPNTLKVQAKEKTTSLVLITHDETTGIYNAYYVDYHGMVIGVLNDTERSYVQDPDAPLESNVSKIAVSEDIVDQMPLVELKSATNAINARISVFNELQVSTILEIYEKLNKEGVMTKTIILEDLKNAKITVKAKEGFLIYMTTEDTIQNQIDNLKILLKEKIGEDRTKIQYIDLRFGDKIFYK